jgi:hypothetical protein
MHVDEDLSDRTVIILASMQIDFVAADAGFLDIALAPIGQAPSPGRKRSARF